MRKSRLTFTLSFRRVIRLSVVVCRNTGRCTFSYRRSQCRLADSGFDSTADGQGCVSCATINNTNTLLKSVVIKTVLARQTDSSLDELCAGIRDTFSNPAVKEISETDSTFLGYHAKTFTYLITKGSQTTYNEATMFVADGTGWTIACVGRPEQRGEIKKIISFYRK